MSTHKRRLSNREEISRCQLIASERFNVSLKVYKIVKSIVVGAGVSACGYGMYLGGDPVILGALIAMMITGPEALEYFWANGAGND